ncbi:MULTISPECIES: undecaprenyldiphospho-muramoylpentapeptide beta-N-acetylglucosaminyltransferase [Sphingopyxis]|uniref:undecaprenyldiphospho-muramoylpentapeptide beta-N-acetylglucosaminyltransferase n=1 Tax=Sphingopyxis TaxID=165697 RepID=UPI0009582D2A|nr:MULTISPECIES: undecaprenyldiphospho-muramoylpentapeptide beta-N-acetylglucosaminyltransferase [Sphingopyxis]APW72312.1 undecaprenyldiphospho-muramoylpentapeptide beta-N-acetylglucosaminyltransferase [Sphingopyxis granuli]AVA13152.1 undecaprenyldiphospho-muramoylpentapeptide beta-N-acetylglucosaminyltransferase [Sphingopyxis sp. MG]QUM71873.1 undecaprenyldiphospho-muramoylpentapeptide beta-N-acetylglucosaminyltransferase [Sphingopyxis granuli]
MTATRHFLLAAGGTGGHMLPAYALAGELIARGHRVALVSDDRGLRIPGAPAKLETHVLPAGRVHGGPVGWVKAALAIRKGRRQAIELIGEFDPAVVVGFGGYPSLPSLLAAGATRRPRVIHEQNAVLGRVNRLMAPRVDAVAVAYRNIHRFPEKQAMKRHLTGNPVREEIVAIREEGFPPLPEDGIVRLLVVGGSLGATVLSEVVPAAIAMLPPALLERLQVVQQAREADIEGVRARYAELGVAAECAPYIADLPERLRWAHLFIGRAGASTVAELACAGRPAIFVPYPHAMDDHQRWNVVDLVEAGGAIAFAQQDFTPAAVAKHIQRMALEPGALEAAAEHAVGCGLPDATRDLADLVESFAPPPLMDVIRVGASAQRAPASGVAAAREAN